MNANMHLRVVVPVLMPADEVEGFYPRVHKRLRKTWEKKSV
jgi:hypothetical protein